MAGSSLDHPESEGMTASVEAEQQTAAAEAPGQGELLVLAKRAARAGTFDLDMRTETVRYCPRSLEMLGHPPDRSPVLSQAEWAEHIYPGDAERVLADGLRARAKRADFITEYRIVAPDGIRWIRGMGRTLFDETGEPMRCVGFNFDITEEKRAEAAFRRMQSELVQGSRANAMACMAETLAHALNQPLTVISSYVSGARTLLERLPGDQAGEVREAFGEVIEATRRAGEIVRNLRALTRRSDGETRPAMLDAAIRKALELSRADAEAQEVDFQCDLESDLSVDIDELQVQQVVYNLVSDALETGEGRRTIMLSCRRQGEDAVVRIRDGAPARPGDRRPFAPFATGDPDQAGIGVAIARTIVEARGGRMWVEPEDEGGAVCLAIPLAAAD